MGNECNQYDKQIKCLGIIVGNGCWLCAGSMILPGVTVKDKSVVAAGAVVTRSQNEGMILLAGIPAKIKKHLNL